MLDDILLAQYMDSFFGYGNTKARLWFVGMEEGGGGTVEEVAARLSAWDQRGRPMVDDVAGFHQSIGQQHWFEPGAPTQSTWRQLIRATLLANEVPVNLEAIREYQVQRFARFDGDVASLELLPLPSTSTRPEHWMYAGWSRLEALTSRDSYQQHCLPQRIAHLRELISRERPSAVVFYGVTYQAHWEAISGARFGTGEFPRTQAIDGTRFYVVPHPTAGPSRSQSMRPQECFEAVGLALRAAFAEASPMSTVVSAPVAMSEEPNLKAADVTVTVESLILFGKRVGQFIQAATEALRRFGPDILSLAVAIKQMPDAMQVALIRLADEGWYLDWTGMSLQEPVELAEAYEAGRRDEVDGQLVEHYRRRLPEIEVELVELIPSRAHIFKQAFDAHRQGLYYVAVPTLLAQADGVCLELLDEHFFMRTPGKKGERFAELANSDLLTKALLAPFFSETSIRISFNRRGPDFDKLNRHLVLHGESFDYGTEVRSLQAISLLYYLTMTLRRVLERRRLPPAEHGTTTPCTEVTGKPMKTG